MTSTERAIRILWSTAAVTASLALGALFVTTSTACGSDCEIVPCDSLVTDSDLTTNGGTYQKCLSCYADGTCETELIDDAGETFYDCVDGLGASCTESSVDAQFAYCEVG